MSEQSSVSALRVADEAFLIASTIERCPKTMMLRELVMNAFEAAQSAPSGSRTVEIRATDIDGSRKLCIWNSGIGMTADELYRVCDLASSLHKQTGLDRNFGMGAKVASLPSNKHGVRYRSCHEGTVSEVILGQRQGVYGRIRQGDHPPGPHGEVVDVTAVCRGDGHYSLDADWTEVVLYGSGAAQDTVRDPYNGNPVLAPDWIGTYLSRRFFRLPEGVGLTIAGETVASGPDLTFRALADRLQAFGRCQSVPVGNGIVVHYCYHDPLVTGSKPANIEALGDIVGLAGIVHRDEIYALREGASWLSEAPTYGFPFGASHCSVFVELPDQFGVRPEAYRQFLRFKDGDQRQVMLADFAALVRDGVPDWLREIIASYGPAQADYLGELSSELQDLLVQLGITARHRGARTPRGAETAADTPPKSADPDRPRPPSLPTFERPPEIISLRDQAQIDERGLQARAARYYPESHQLFVNVSYSAVDRLKAAVLSYFEAEPDRERVDKAAQDVAEWAITGKVARALVYTLGKKDSGWTPEEVGRAQSPESLSVVADDCNVLIRAARGKLAEALGLTLEADERDPALGARSAWTQRVKGELADAHQAARKALSNGTGNPAPLLRRVSEVEARRGNLVAAVEWAERAAEADPEDALTQMHLSAMFQRHGALGDAERAARRAMDLSPVYAVRALRQLSGIARQRNDLDTALALARQAVEADPAEPWAYGHLAAILQGLGQMEEAVGAVQRALDLATSGRGQFLRQLSGIELQRRNLDAALDFAEQAVAADPQDAWAQSHLAGVLVQRGDLDEAARHARQALALGGLNPSRLLLQLSSIEERRKNVPVALDLARQAAAADPADAAPQTQLARLLMQQGDLEGAEAAARAALAMAPETSSRSLVQLSSIESLRKNPSQAVALAQEAVSKSPNDPWVLGHMSGMMLQAGDAAGAEQAARQALALSPQYASRWLRQLSTIELYRRNMAAAVGFAQQAIAADPSDPWAYNQLAGLLLQRGDLDGAEEAAQAALARSSADATPIQHRIAAISMSRARALT